MRKLWTLAVAAVALTGCGIADSYVTKVENVGKDQVDDYCETTPAPQRASWRDRLAYENGVPRLMANCDPDSPDFVAAP